jgi:transposase
VLLVNARHVKNVPGRKTDVKDCQWLAQLLQHGLLRGSFIPPKEQRELRDLTRHRSQLVAEKARTANRIQKLLEDANIKLASVATDVLGKSGRDMLAALVAGETDAGRLSELARGRLINKKEDLAEALTGQVSEHHRFMLRILLDQLAELEGLISRLEERIEEKCRPFEAVVEVLDEVPGINRQVAYVLLAEIGSDMSHFRDAAHLCSWASMCPGNNESAGKRKSGRTGHGNRWLRQALSQAGWAASHSKKSYFSAQYRNIARRRGKKRALVAVGHSLLVVYYHLLTTGECYQDLGPDFFDRRQPEQLTRYLVKRLERLGHKVTIEPAQEAA